MNPWREISASIFKSSLSALELSRAEMRKGWIAQDLSAYFAKGRINPDGGRAVRDSLGAELPNFSQRSGYFRLSL